LRERDQELRRRRSGRLSPMVWLDLPGSSQTLVRFWIQDEGLGQAQIIAALKQVARRTAEDVPPEFDIPTDHFPAR
jgi:hypothetical protein